MKKVWSYLRQHATIILKFEKKKMLPLIRMKTISRCKTLLHFWEKNLKKVAKSKNDWKIRDYCHCAGK